MRTFNSLWLVGLCLVLGSTGLQAGTAERNTSGYNQARQAPNKNAGPDYRKLKALFKGERSRSERHKIEAVNRFFNKISFVPDSQNWGQSDYWASPKELLERAAGDCEDYTIAKYFALRKLGIPKQRLRITYVHSSLTREAHMVLVYFDRKDKNAWVLDNLTDTIEALHKRTDLKQVYAFNEADFWYSRNNQTIRGGSADRIVAWKKMLDQGDWVNFFRG